MFPSFNNCIHGRIHNQSTWGTRILRGMCREAGKKTFHPIMSLIRYLGRSSNFWQLFLKSNLNLYTYVVQGALVYPTMEFLSRLWTVYKFVVQVLPILHKSTYLLRDLVAFLSPKMEDCSTFQCQLTAHGESNRELVSFVLQKFLSPMLANKANLTLTEKAVKKFVPLHSKNRRLDTLKQ